MDDEDTSLSWRSNFETYVEQIRVAANDLYQDLTWKDEIKNTYPNVDVKASIQAALTNYWKLESTWETMKRKRTGKKVRMKDWLKKGFHINKVYYPK